MPDQYTLLLEFRRSETASRGLVKLPHDFFAVTNAYLSDLRRTFESELKENPSSRKGELARQTYQRGSQVARDLVEARMMKILSLGFQASVGGAKEVLNALPEERSLFEELVSTLTDHRLAVAPYLAPLGAVGSGTLPTGPTAEPRRAPAPTSRPTETAGRTRPPAVAFVRIVQDSKALAIGPETLELRKEDLLSLPEESAKLLVGAKIAEPVEAPRAD